MLIKLGVLYTDVTPFIYVQDALYKERVEVPIKCIQGILYVRLSVHVYNTLDDYVRLADVIVSLAEGDAS